MKGYTVVELMVALAIISSVTGAGFTVYIIGHFVLKFW